MKSFLIRRFYEEIDCYQYSFIVLYLSLVSSISVIIYISIFVYHINSLIISYKTNKLCQENVEMEEKSWQA